MVSPRGLQSWKQQAGRKHLSADALHALILARCERIPDGRPGRSVISLSDALLSAFAMFSLKDPSLLAFDARRNDENMKRLYRIGQVPSDTQMRAILDQVDPSTLRPVFNDVFRELQRGKVLEQFLFHGAGYLLCLDGTGYFSSEKIHCPCCLEKVDSKTGETSYSHQMLGAALVHPEPGDHEFLYEQLIGAFDDDRVSTLLWKAGETTCELSFVNGLPLNQLMMLAFLVNQVEQLCCPLFRAVWKKFRTKRALWDNIRSHYRHFLFDSMRHLYEVMLYDLAREVAAPVWNTS